MEESKWVSYALAVLTASGWSEVQDLGPVANYSCPRCSATVHYVEYDDGNRALLQCTAAPHCWDQRDDEV